MLRVALVWWSLEVPRFFFAHLRTSSYSLSLPPLPRQFSEKELAAITEIANQPDPFGLVVASVCPGIFGHEMVKAGLILGLFGGSQSDGGAVRSLSSYVPTPDPLPLCTTTFTKALHSLLALFYCVPTIRPLRHPQRSTRACGGRPWAWQEPGEPL